MPVAEAPVASKNLIASLGLDDNFHPAEPGAIKESGLSEAQIEDLILKVLLGLGSASGKSLADRICLPFVLLEDVYHSLRQRQIITPTGSAMLGDYVYQLTDQGRERSQRAMKACSYIGPAPVPLEDYVDSVNAQTIRAEKPRRHHLEQAFKGIHVESRMFDNLGPAINAGKGMFLYGPPGNGKTTLAQRITKCFGQTILVPHSIIEDGQIIKFFDAASHVAVHSESHSIFKSAEFDRRWLRIKRPTVVVGGELTMDALELKHDPTSNISEASLQLKSNCGCLLIDDFGRQRIDPAQLLNRWIIPLENRIDYLTLPTGKKIEVPFEQLIIFSTNLEPRDLADDAFLRRIPYKIEVGDPSREEFHLLFEMFAQSQDLEYRSDAVEYLVEKHYVATGRPLRRCQPRDLLTHIINYCEYHDLPVAMDDEYLDRAVDVYFTVVSGKE
jgi:predicted ATPase with chaperone activity